MAKVIYKGSWKEGDPPFMGRAGFVLLQGCRPTAERPQSQERPAADAAAHPSPRGNATYPDAKASETPGDQPDRAVRELSQEPRATLSERPDSAPEEPSGGDDEEPQT